MKQIIISVLLALSLNCCHKNDSDYLHLWRKDKNACLGIRTAEKTQELIADLKIEKLQYDEVIQLLGTPDRLHDIEEVKYAEYYIENNCSSSEKDVCMLSISFLKS